MKTLAAYDGRELRKLPASLYAAYEHTKAGGELHVLAGLTGPELATYAAESAANSDGTVTADDIEALGEWLRGGIGRTS